VFKKMFIISLIRNTLFLLALTAVIISFCIQIINDNAIQDRFDLLDSLKTEGYLAKPNQSYFDYYNYYYVIFDQNGNEIESDLSDRTTDDRTFEQVLLNRTIFSANPIQRIFQSLHNNYLQLVIGASLYTAKIVQNPISGEKTFYIFSSKKSIGSWNRSIGVITSINMIAILISVALGLIATYLEMIPIRKTWETQNRLITSISHELRTPLASVKTSLDMLSDEKYASVITRDRLIEIIELEAGHMNSLVERLLTIMRIEAKQQVLVRESFNLDDILVESLDIVSPLAIEKGVILDDYTYQNLNIYADKQKLKMVISALLKNAVQYTPTGKRVSVSVGRNARFVEITVSDEGPGIDKKEAKKIFNLFYHNDKSLNNGGFGVGLYISKQFIKEQKGRIAVKSNKNGGTRFIVILPVYYQKKISIQ